MAEYIEREAVIDKLLSHSFTDSLYGMGLARGLEIAVEEVKRMPYREIPAADVAPVVHGEWIPCDPDSDVRFYCSECGTEISTSWDYDCDEMWNGCPHCLAKMDGGKNDAAET